LIDRPQPLDRFQDRPRPRRHAHIDECQRETVAPVSSACCTRATPSWPCKRRIDVEARMNGGLARLAQQGTLRSQQRGALIGTSEDLSEVLVMARLSSMTNTRGLLGGGRVSHMHSPQTSEVTPE